VSDTGFLYKNGDIIVKFDLPTNMFNSDILDILKYIHHKCLLSIDNPITILDQYNTVKNIIANYSYLCIVMNKCDTIIIENNIPVGNILVNCPDIMGLCYCFKPGYNFDLPDFSKWLEKVVEIYDMYNVSSKYLGFLKKYGFTCQISSDNDSSIVFNWVYNNYQSSVLISNNEIDSINCYGKSIYNHVPHIDYHELEDHLRLLNLVD
jgi:hypothetical protein